MLLVFKAVVLTLACYAVVEIFKKVRTMIKIHMLKKVLKGVMSDFTVSMVEDSAGSGTTIFLEKEGWVIPFTKELYSILDADDSLDISLSVSSDDPDNGVYLFISEKALEEEGTITINRSSFLSIEVINGEDDITLETSYSLSSDSASSDSFIKIINSISENTAEVIMDAYCRVKGGYNN